jgi:hypothetical protein
MTPTNDDSRITARNVMPAKLSRVRRAAVSSVVLSRTRSMMNRMNSGSIICRPGADQREAEERADAVAMRPEPSQVLAQILATFAAEERRLFLGPLSSLLTSTPTDVLPACLVRTVVEPLVAVVADEMPVALAGRAQVTSARIREFAHSVRM